MVDPWQVLRDGGLPLALPRSDARPTPRQLADATLHAIAAEPRGREADALTAFVLAWSHHWPNSFADAFGAEAARVSVWATLHATDANRYLKLRRIALENLASVL